MRVVWDPDGDPIRITHINGQAVTYGEPMSLPSGSSLTIFADGTFRYTPPPNFVGSDSFSLTISDDLDSYTAMVNIQVTNNAPYAYDASFSVLHDRELTGQVYGYDRDGDVITAQLVSGPTNGTLTFQPDGSFTYTPNTHYVGADSFTYTWSDGLTSGNTATVSIDVYNNAPLVADVVMANLTRPGEVPRTKDVVQLNIGSVSDPDGDAVGVKIEWQVNGETKQVTQELVNQPLTESVVSQFDLSVPGHGDVGDQITVQVKLDDGTGELPVYSATFTVENTPPVITSITVEGYQAFEDDVYYFVEGQEPTIRIRVLDDDLKQSPEREMVRVELAEDALPAGLQFEGAGYVDDNDEAVIRGTIQRHGAEQATQYYRPRFRAWDNRGGQHASPFLAVGATDFRVTVVKIWVPQGNGPNNRVSIQGTTLQQPMCFYFEVEGVGSRGSNWFKWSLYDTENRNLELFSRVGKQAPRGQGAMGSWKIPDAGNPDPIFGQPIKFWLYLDQNGKIAGIERSTGTTAALKVNAFNYYPWPFNSSFNVVSGETLYVSAN